MKRNAALFFALSLIALLLTGGILKPSQAYTPQSPGNFNLNSSQMKGSSSLLSRSGVLATQVNTIPVTGLVGSTQTFTWTVPATVPPTKTGVIKVIATDRSGNRDEAVSTLGFQG